MSAAPYTEPVDVESLSPGDKVIVGQTTWLILANEPTDASEERCKVRLTRVDDVNGVGIERIYSRTAKFAVICQKPQS
jgi:hypothetical protein